MASRPLGTGNFSIGNVFSRMLGNISRTWIVAVGTAIVVAGLNKALQAMQMSDLMARAARAPANPAAIFGSGFYWLAVFGSWFTTSFANCAMIGAMLSRGDGNDFGYAISIGLRKLLPMVGLTFLWTIAVSLGMVLFLVPGLMLITIWAVSAPALVAEPGGPIAALGRSRALTRGYRWPVFGALLVLGIVYFMALGVVSAGRFSAAMSGLGQFQPLGFGQIVTQVVVFGALWILVAAFLAALYQELVAAKEGGDASALADVFA